MPDVFDADGLEVKTLSEITTELEDDYKDTYGTDINLDSDSPDGQQIGIVAQAAIDVRELIVQVNAGFDPDQAEGVILDQRCALNGITRNAGSFTFTDIDVEVSKALTLRGLDAQADELEPTNSPFTVKDDEGNEFYLLDSQSMTGSGTYSFSFRAKEIGEVQTTTNTITTIVTVTSGVVSVNNPDAASSIGVDEESDFSLKNRRRAAVSKNAVGPVDALQAALADLDGVTVAKVYENDTNVVDANGQDPNSVWCIVEGGDPDEIAETIYSKKGMGCKTVGDEEVSVTRQDGRTTVMRYDVPDTEDLYIRFAITGATVDEDYIKNAIVANLFWEIGADADGSSVTEYLKSLNSAYQITDMELSNDGLVWDEIIEPSAITSRFINATARITIL